MMNRSFFITPGYKLSRKEYSGLVKKFSNSIPRSSVNLNNLQNRFLSLIDKSYIQISDSYCRYFDSTYRDCHLYVIPSQKDAKLILAYGNLIVRMEGR